MSFSAPPDEKILMVLRRHPVILALELFGVFIAALLPIGIFVVLQDIDSILKDEPYRQLIVLGVVIYYFYLWLTAFFIWYDYILDIGVVTERRIVDIEQHGLFGREVSEYFLHNLQDVTVKQNGIMPMFFDYGDIVFSTKSARSFTLYEIPEPSKIRSRIMELYLQEKE